MFTCFCAPVLFLCGVPEVSAATARSTAPAVGGGQRCRSLSTYACWGEGILGMKFCRMKFSCRDMQILIVNGVIILFLSRDFSHRIFRVGKTGFSGECSALLDFSQASNFQELHFQSMRRPRPVSRAEIMHDLVQEFLVFQ